MSPISNSVNVTSLNREAKDYDSTLRTLPYFTLEELIKKFKMNVLQISGEHIRTTFQRRSGIMKPYSTTVTEDNSEEIGKVVESKLKTEMAYCQLVDSILNYKEVKVLSNAGEKIDNKTKKHPLERKILETVVRTWSEDVVDAAFFGERDTTDLSPLGSFDGFETKILGLISDGEISAAKGNLINSGEITDPANNEDTDALDAVVTWFKSLNPKLRKQHMIWMVPETVLFRVLASLDNKMHNRVVVTMQHLVDYLKTHAWAQKLDIVSDTALGTGQRWYVTVPGNMDFGMNTMTDGQFVQVRNIHKDPNLVQFWIQAEYGTRWIEWHPKMFACNEQAAIANSLSGDYDAAS